MQRRRNHATPWKTFCAGPLEPRNFKSLENLYERSRITNVMRVTESASDLLLTGRRRNPPKINSSHENNGLMGVAGLTCGNGRCGLRVCLLRRRKLIAIAR